MAKRPKRPSDRLQRLYQKLLPRERGLHAELRRIDQTYGTWVAEATGEERESRISQHMHMRDEVLEQLEGIATQRLLRRAAKHPTVIVPEIRRSGKYGQDEHWEQGHATGEWYLKRAAYASVYREIEEAERRRREVWEFRIKIASTVLPWLVALVSVLVSLMLAWRPWKLN